jgi:hypothetical protein
VSLDSVTRDVIRISICWDSVTCNSLIGISVCWDSVTWDSVIGISVCWDLVTRGFSYRDFSVLAFGH